MRAKPRVLVVVEGGVVSCVITTVKGLEVCVQDWDNMKAGGPRGCWCNADATVSARVMKAKQKEGVI